MDLTQPLITLVTKIDEAFGVILADKEGEEVTSYSIGKRLALPQREMDERLKLISAYQAINLKSYRQFMQQFQLGSINQMIYCYTEATVIIKAVNHDYALILTMQPESNLGRSVFYLNQTADTIRQDL